CCRKICSRIFLPLVLILVVSVHPNQFGAKPAKNLTSLARLSLTRPHLKDGKTLSKKIRNTASSASSTEAKWLVLSIQALLPETWISSVLLWPNHSRTVLVCPMVQSLGPHMLNYVLIMLANLSSIQSYLPVLNPSKCQKHNLLDSNNRCTPGQIGVPKHQTAILVRMATLSQ